MNCYEIIKEHLIKNKYDGLLNSEIPCGCGLEDLAPCDCENIGECEPAYKHTGDICKKCECTCDGYDEENAVCFRRTKQTKE